MRELEAATAAKEIADDILERHSSNKGGLLFLMGAGASYSCGIPMASEIAEQLKEKLVKEEKWCEPDLDKSREMSQYEWAMHHIKHKDMQIDLIRKYIEKARSSDGSWKLNYCYLVLAEIWKAFPLYPRTLLTTNFDPLFFYSMQELYIEPKLIRHVAEMDHMNPFHTDIFPSIIFLHGYWQNHFILNTPDEWSQFKKDWVPRLAAELKNYGLVVIGYSGAYNDILMLTLKYIRETMMTRLSGPIYWCYVAPISNETYASLSELGNVKLVKLYDADSFMLQVGEALNLEKIKTVAAFSRIITKQQPGFIEDFKSHANIVIHPINGGRNGIKLLIHTHRDYAKPGENYAGIDINTVQRLFDLSRYSELELQYDAEVSPPLLSGKSFFEVKLQSVEAGHIELVETGRDQIVKIPLQKYDQKGVNLRAIKKIIIAANCEQIGCDASLELILKRIDWCKGDSQIFHPSVK
jgi:hypothetical protein